MEGKLGGSMVVHGEGRWKEVSSEVNSMLSMLTDMIRTATEVASAVSKGEFQSFSKEASGEFSLLKCEINQMISIVSNERTTKARFFVNIMQQLTGPIQRVIAMLENPLENRELLISSANDLLNSIVYVLDLSRMESGTMELATNALSLRSSVTAALAAVSQKKCNLEFVWDIQPEVPDYVKGDKARLQQILACLVGCAITNTNSGDVVLKVEMQI